MSKRDNSRNVSKQNNNNRSKRQLSPEEKQRKLKAAEQRQRILKRRRMVMAISMAIVVAVAALLILYLMGFFYKKASTNTLTLEKNGSVTYEEILDASDISTSELKSFVKSEIKNYNSSADGRVALKQVSTGSKAYLRTTYDSVATYGDFTSYFAWNGTVSELSDNGYTYSDVFVSVEDGSKGDTVTADTILENGDYNVLIIKENATVVVPGTIVYVSNDSTEIKDDDTVSISQADGNCDASTMTYIIYK